eukprot:3012529-Pyramimonas_sp.AAC.1
MSKKISQLLEVAQRLVGDHRVRVVPPVQGGREMWGCRLGTLADELRCCVVVADLSGDSIVAIIHEHGR